MGRHHRRGYLGSTNLNALRDGVDCGEHVRARRLSNDEKASAMNARPPKAAAAGDPPPPMQHANARRKPDRPSKFQLALPPIACHDHPPDHLDGCLPLEQLSDVKTQLGRRINHMQGDRKSFKDEPWYRSPVGFGSQSSVLIAAFKQQDPLGTGYIQYKDLVRTLESQHFGLKEREVRALLEAVAPSWSEEPSGVHYKSFVRKLQLEPKDTETEDVIFRHQTYVQKIREHANQLVDRSFTMGFGDAPSGSNASNSPDKQNTPDVVRGSNGSFTRLPLINRRLSEGSESFGRDVDRMSYEFDKKRKQGREDAKSRTLLAHINRIEAYSQHQQQMMEQQAAMSLATKAMHHGEHLARIYEAEHKAMHLAERHGKGLLHSPTTRINKSVSKDSMFYHDNPA